MMMLGMIPPLSQAFLKWRLQASLLGIKFLSHLVCTNCYNFLWDIDMCQTSPSFGKPSSYLTYSSKHCWNFLNLTFMS